MMNNKITRLFANKKAINLKTGKTILLDKNIENINDLLLIYDIHKFSNEDKLIYFNIEILHPPYQITDKSYCNYSIIFSNPIGNNSLIDWLLSDENNFSIIEDQKFFYILIINSLFYDEKYNLKIKNSFNYETKVSKYFIYEFDIFENKINMKEVLLDIELLIKLFDKIKIIKRIRNIIKTIGIEIETIECNHSAIRINKDDLYYLTNINTIKYNYINLDNKSLYFILINLEFKLKEYNDSQAKADFLIAKYKEEEKLYKKEE